MAWYDEDPIVEPKKSAKGNFWEADEIVAPKTALPKEEGFFSDMRERGGKLANIVSATKKGEQTKGEGVFQGAMNLVGTGGRVIGEGVSLAGKGAYAVAPESWQKGLKDTAQYVAESPVGQLAGQGMQAYEQNLETFNKGNPRAGRNYEAVREFSNLVPLGSSGVRSAAGKAAEVGGGALRNVARDTAMAPVSGAVSLAKGISARTGEELAGEKALFKQSAGAIRDVMKAEGVVINPTKASDIASGISAELKNLEFIPELSPKTSIIVGKIADAAKSEQGVSLNQLDQYRRLLRTARDEDTVAAGAVRRTLDKAVKELQPQDLLKGDKDAIGLLDLFRKEYTQAAKFEDVADIVKKAGGDPNKIKSGLTTFLNNEDNTIGWSKEELAIANKAAKYSAPEKILKGLGRFGYDPGNVFLPLVGSGVVGFGAGTPAAIGLGLSGTASRQLYKVLGRGKAEQLLQKIESGSKIGMGEANSLPPKVVLELQKRGLIQGKKK